MNKLTVILLLVSLFAGRALSAGGTHVDLRVAAFYPSDKRMRETYGDWQVNYEIEAEQFLSYNYDLWANISYFSTNGRSETLHTKIRFRNTSVSCGIKHLFCINPFTQLYLGAGINGAFVYVHNHTPDLPPYANKTGVGGVFKVGLHYMPMHRLFFEIFTDYLYQKIHFERSVQIGGVKVGGGVGLIF